MFTNERSIRATRRGSVTRMTAQANVRSLDMQRWLVMAASGLLALALILGSIRAEARSAPDSFADLAEKLSPAVVNISTTQTINAGDGDVPMPEFPPGSPFEDLFKDFLDRQRRDRGPQQVTSLGSGFIIDPAGIVVTNNHVVQDAEEITVTLADGTKLEAKLKGRDTKTDIAVLTVKTDKALPYVDFGDSDEARVGDWVMAIGNPFGLGGSVSAGIISARNRDINSGPYDDFIQTDAAINRGNSGGPLFTMDGKVIGVNTAIYSPSGGSVGIGFSIPSALVHSVVDQIIQYGETRRGWLGVRVQSVTDDIAESLGMDRAHGALVASVDDTGPAADAGIRAGDVIVTFDGKDIPEMRALPRVVAETKIGATVDVALVRDGKPTNVKVKVGQLNEAMAEQEEDEKPSKESSGKTQTVLGLTLAALDDTLRDKYKVDADVAGVLVVDVKPNSNAADRGIRPGDVIVEVAQEKVSKPEAVAEKVKAEREAGKKSALFLLAREGDLRFVAVKLDDK